MVLDKEGASEERDASSSLDQGLEMINLAMDLALLVFFLVGFASTVLFSSSVVASESWVLVPSEE